MPNVNDRTQEHGTNKTEELRPNKLIILVDLDISLYMYTYMYMYLFPMAGACLHRKFALETV